jgi:hypothetical protein
LVDSGASFHLISKGHLTPEEIQRIKPAQRPVTLQTADRPISATHVVEIYVQDLDATFLFYVLENCQPVLSMGQLRHARYKFAWSDDTANGMVITLPNGTSFETMMQNDVPRIFVADEGHAANAADTGTNTSDELDSEEGPPKPKRRRHRRKSITPIQSESTQCVEGPDPVSLTNSLQFPLPLQQQVNVTAAEDSATDEDDVCPILLRDSSGDECTYNGTGMQDSESDSSDEDFDEMVLGKRLIAHCREYMKTKNKNKKGEVSSSGNTERSS